MKYEHVDTSQLQTAFEHHGKLTFSQARKVAGALRKAGYKVTVDRECQDYPRRIAGYYTGIGKAWWDSPDYWRVLKIIQEAL